MNEDMKPTVLKWAAEYNELAAKGGDMWDELKTMGERGFCTTKAFLESVGIWEFPYPQKALPLMEISE
jgi:hypothetical protein